MFEKVFYDMLEPKIREITMGNQIDDKLQMELTSVLVIITYGFLNPIACFDTILTQSRQRASNIDSYSRESRLASFVQPVRQAWQDEEFRRLSSSFEGFCTLLGLQSVGPYMQTTHAQKLENWTEVVLDSDGKQIQEEMTRKFQVFQKPLRKHGRC